MKVLVFDTETTGLLPSRFPLMTSNIDTFPYIVQLSYIIYDTDKHKILHEQNNIIILPDKAEMSEQAVAVHGISKQLAKNRGIHIESALEILSLYLQQCKMVVAHNIDFDMTMVEAECLRAKIKYPFTSEKIYYCTMNKTKDMCNIIRKFRNIGPYGQLRMESYIKKPTLRELHMHLFNTTPKGLHDAMVDVRVCLRCFLKVVYDKKLEFGVSKLAMET